MRDRNRVFILVTFIALVFPQTGLSQGNIYQEAIPHLKACISLIQERESTPSDTHSENIDLREVCPTLSYFLTYEAISEIDPPLENHSSRAYLEALVSLLEDIYQPVMKKAESTDNIRPYTFQNDPDHKPFLMALSQWT